jgi:hypothetical protein
MGKFKMLIFVGVVWSVIGVNAVYSQNQERNSEEIYRLAVTAALQDREISDEEQNILEALRGAYAISKEDARRIESEVLATLPKAFDQSGRWELVLQNIALGTGLYGWGIPLVLDVKDIKWYIGGTMLSTGAAYYLTYQLTKKMDISHARAHMFRMGAFTGMSWGNTIARLIDYEDYKLKIGLLMLGAPVGMVLNDRLYLRWQPSLGQSWSLSQWSEVTADVLKNIQNIVDPKPELPENIINELFDKIFGDYDRKLVRWENRRAILNSVGVPLGMYLGHKFYGNRQYSFGDGILLSTGRITGLLYSILVYDLIFHPKEDFDAPSWYVFNSAMSVAGIVVTDRLIKNKDYTVGQAILTTAGGVSGGLFGAGIGIILEVDDNSRVMDLLALGGSLGGFYLANRVMNVRSEAENAPQTSKFSLTPYLVPVGKRCQAGLSLTYSF